MRGLTRLQERITRTVLAATAPHGFALAGGAGLVAAGLSRRATEDIDAFSAVTDVREAAEAAVAALEADGLAVTRDRFEPSLVRLIVTAGTVRRRRQVRVELGRDRIEWPPTATRLGAVLSSRELAANKVLALFSRIRPRDLCDIAILSTGCDLEQVLLDATVKDPGFSRPILAEMTRMVLVEPDDLWPANIDLDTVRAFGQRFVKALEDGDDLHGLMADGPIWSNA
ncbi:MAG: nucleotidyl transferase AbiEii/AbiGii toxin family protein [Acidimicrobiales bacterium]